MGERSLVIAATDAEHSSEDLRRMLVIGFGNPGRRDDGLGPALAARLEALGLPGVTVESDYQLSIEHAHLIAGHDIVVFADAARDVTVGDPFYLRPVSTVPDAPCYSHHVSPAAVLRLAADCFDARPSAWLLGLRGIDLDSFAEGLTPEAETNLTVALNALCGFLESANRQSLEHLSGCGCGSDYRSCDRGNIRAS